MSRIINKKIEVKMGLDSRRVYQIKSHPKYKTKHTIRLGTQGSDFWERQIQSHTIESLIQVFGPV